MDKRLAHIVLLVFDALSIWALYHVFYTWHEVSQSITSSVNSIELQSPFGIYMVTMVMPIVHSQSLIRIESKSTEKARNYLISSLLFSLLLAGLVFDYLIEKEVTNAGSKYCSSESETLTFSQFKVYVKDRPCQ